MTIELAKSGLPRPKGFSADQDKLPEGHVVLELEREQPAAPTPDTRR